MIVIHTVYGILCRPSIAATWVLKTLFAIRSQFNAIWQMDPKWLSPIDQTDHQTISKKLFAEKNKSLTLVQQPNPKVDC